LRVPGIRRNTGEAQERKQVFKFGSHLEMLAAGRALRQGEFLEKRMSGGKRTGRIMAKQMFA
jgi:hypothetical protein